MKQHPIHPRNRRGNAGFTLLEMGIVLLIIAALVGGGLTLFSISLQRQQFQETQNKLQAIQKALLDYRRAFNRLPCPADLTRAMDATANNYYGVEAADTGYCLGGVPAANFVSNPVSFTGEITAGSRVMADVTYTGALAAGLLLAPAAGIVPAGTHILSIDTFDQLTLDQIAVGTLVSATFTFLTYVQGMVPTKALGLPDEFAIDGWGRRIFYAVDVRFTGKESIPSISMESTSYGMTVRSAAGNNKTTQAAYVLVSTGPNGHGGYPRSASTRIDADSTNADELNNCDCNANAGATGLNAIFVQKPWTKDPASLTNNFDDIVAFATRQDLRRVDE